MVEEMLESPLNLEGFALSLTNSLGASLIGVLDRLYVLDMFDPLVQGVQTYGRYVD